MKFKINGFAEFELGAGRTFFLSDYFSQERLFTKSKITLNYQKFIVFHEYLRIKTVWKCLERKRKQRNQ